jgi:hypothetical protein
MRPCLSPFSPQHTFLGTLLTAQAATQLLLALTPWQNNLQTVLLGLKVQAYHGVGFV